MEKSVIQGPLAVNSDMIFILLFILFDQTLATEFGFLFYDCGNVFPETFVAFGTASDHITSSDRTIVSNELNRFYRYHQKEKIKLIPSHSNNTNRIPFKVHLRKKLELSTDKVQVALKGELSEFLALFHTVLKASSNIDPVWRKVSIYPDPIVIMSKASFERAPIEIQVTLTKAAFKSTETIEQEESKIIEESKLNLDEFPDANITETELKIVTEFENDNSFFTIVRSNSSTGSLNSPLIRSRSNPSYRKNSKNTRCNCCLIL